MALPLQIPKVVGRIAVGTFLLAAISYGIGLRAVYLNPCGHVRGAGYAFFGLWLAAFSSGLLAAYALSRRVVRAWLLLVVALALSPLAYYALEILALTCSGV